MAAGMQAEKLFWSFLSEIPTATFVEDVRNDLRWQQLDVDFRVLSRQGVFGLTGWINVEGKSDRHLDQSGNWIFELYRVNHTAPLPRIYVRGWSVRSEAHLLLFYAPSSHRIHSITMNDYRIAFANAVRIGDCRFDPVQTDNIKTTINAYFPERFAHGMPSYRVKNLT